MNADIISMCLGVLVSTNLGPLFADISTKMNECLNHHRNGGDNVLSEHAQVTAHSSHTMNRTIIKGQRCTNNIHCVGAVGCDLSMFTQHIIAAISVMIQTFTHFVADISKQGP